MNVEIITIGNELLIGQVVDTNSAWMGQQLNNVGFDVTRITSIEDKGAIIKSALDRALQRADVVLMTGGLGPTKDDITKITLAEYFNSELVFSESVFEDVCQFLKGRVNNINELNKGQAYVPANCEVIPNPVGTAPVMWFNHQDKIVVSMPGVPSEMKKAMTDAIIPRLKSKYTTGHIIHKTIQIFNIPEAVLAEQLEDWETDVPEYISVAYLPAPGRIRLRLTAKTKQKEQAQNDIDNLVAKLHGLIGDNIFAEQDISIAQMLAKRLKEKGSTMAVAESCTGGNIGRLITSLSGSSTYFKGGVIAYENAVKEKVLSVSPANLEQFGAVSQQVVEQMALGVKELLGADYAVATSGIAGPDGGSDEKPVGTVWIAVAGDFGLKSKCYKFGTIRERNIQRASETALIMLMKEL